MWKSLFEFSFDKNGKFKSSRKTIEIEKINKMIHSELKFENKRIESNPQSTQNENDKTRKSKKQPIEAKVKSILNELVSIRIKQDSITNTKQTRQILQEILYALSSENQERITRGLVSLQKILTTNLGKNLFLDELIISNIIGELITLDHQILNSQETVLECLTLLMVGNPIVYTESLKKLLATENLDQFQILLLLGAIQKGIVVLFSSKDLQNYFWIFLRAESTENKIMFGKRLSKK